MTGSGRGILRLGDRSDRNATEDVSVEIGVFDVVLPCRTYRVAHKVAELGKVSLTTEFLLRLLHSVEGMQEADVASYFGFNHREMSFILNEAESYGYIQRDDGRLWLTESGTALFDHGSEEPQIFQVEERVERAGFDQISFALQDRVSLDRFELELHELQADQVDLSRSLHRIPAAFQRHFSEIVSRRDASASTKKSLYSIDGVTPDERFLAVVPVSLRSAASQPSIAEPDLSAWRPDHELEDRARVLTAIGKFTDQLKTARSAMDARAYDILVELAPEFLKDFIRRDGLAVERYFKEVVARAGEFRSDRPTVPLIGPLFTKSNSRRLFDALGHAMGAANSELWPTKIYWRIPQIATWGMTRALPVTLTALAQKLAGAAQDGRVVECTALVHGKVGRHLAFAFSKVVNNSDSFPSSLELLCIPNLVTAAIVHSPVLAVSGHSVPLGLLSFDPAVNAKAALLLQTRAGLSDLPMARRE